MANKLGMCIYCGGQEPATTRDHNPAIVFFHDRQRPKGLEFPSCEACNGGTKTSELVVAAISRIYPDHSGDGGRELKSLFQAVNNNAPGLLEELALPRAAARFAALRNSGVVGDDGGFLRFSGPTLTAHLELVAAKLAFGLHFQTTKKPIPVGGGAISLVHTNLNLFRGEIPDVVLDQLGSPSTLRQGKKNAEQEFLYETKANESGTISMSFASFRTSFAFTMFASERKSDLMIQGAFPTKVFQPGDFKTPIPKTEFYRLSHTWVARPIHK